MPEISFPVRLWPNVLPQYRVGIGTPRHYFTVRVFDSAAEKVAAYYSFAPRYTLNLIPSGEPWRACVVEVHRGDKTRHFPLFAVMFLERDRIDRGDLAHESVHVATALLRGVGIAKSGGTKSPRLNLGSQCLFAEERFAYLVGAATSGVIDGLCRFGIWTTATPGAMMQAP